MILSKKCHVNINLRHMCVLFIWHVFLPLFNLTIFQWCKCYTILFFRVFLWKSCNHGYTKWLRGLYFSRGIRQDTELEPAQHLKLYVQAKGTQAQRSTEWSQRTLLIIVTNQQSVNKHSTDRAESNFLTQCSLFKS